MTDNKYCYSTFSTPNVKTMMVSITGQFMAHVFLKPETENTPLCTHFLEKYPYIRPINGQVRTQTRLPNTHTRQFYGWKHGSARPHLDPRRAQSSALTLITWHSALNDSNRDVHTVARLTEEMLNYFTILYIHCIVSEIQVKPAWGRTCSERNPIHYVTGTFFPPWK